jgi:hypothetical protein
VETTGFSAGPERNGLGGAVASLAMVIATSLANIHGTGECITGLITLAFVLIHDSMIRKR